MNVLTRLTLAMIDDIGLGQLEPIVQVRLIRLAAGTTDNFGGLDPEDSRVRLLKTVRQEFQSHLSRAAASEVAQARLAFAQETLRVLADRDVGFNAWTAEVEARREPLTVPRSRTTSADSEIAEARI